MKTWIKLYTEILDDPDQGTLTWAQRGIWSALLALAGKLDHRDAEGRETGQLGILEDIAWYLRCDSDELLAVLKVLIDHRIMHELDGTFYLTDYPRQQASSMSHARAVSMPYKDYLTTAYWRELRARVLKTADYRCQNCGSSDTDLDVHHETYGRLGYESPEDLTVLCRRCHRLAHGKDS